MPPSARPPDTPARPGSRRSPRPRRGWRGRTPRGRCRADEWPDRRRSSRPARAPIRGRAPRRPGAPSIPDCVGPRTAFLAKGTGPGWFRGARKPERRRGGLEDIPVEGPPQPSETLASQGGSRRTGRQRHRIGYPCGWPMLRGAAAGLHLRHVRDAITPALRTSECPVAVSGPRPTASRWRSSPARGR